MNNNNLINKEIIKGKKNFINIKSKYILKNVINYIPKKIWLNAIKKINININTLDSPCKEVDLKYYQIYSNNNKEEIKRTYLIKEDKLTKNKNYNWLSNYII